MLKCRTGCWCAKWSLRENDPRLERWSLSNDLGSIPRPTLCLLIICNSSFRTHSALFWPLWALSTHMVHRHIYRQYTRTVFKIKRERMILCPRIQREVEGKLSLIRHLKVQGGRQRTNEQCQWALGASEQRLTGDWDNAVRWEDISAMALSRGPSGPELPGKIMVWGRLEMSVTSLVHRHWLLHVHMSPPYFQEAWCGMLNLHTRLKYAAQDLIKCIRSSWSFSNKFIILY